MADTGFVIVGGGLAAAKAAEGLREQGYGGSLTLVGAERHLPYERPPLSKGYLAGKDARESFDVHNRDWYDDQQVELVLGTAATTIDREAHAVTLADSRQLPYDKLLLATGSRPRTLTLPGSDASGIHTLRNVEDSEAIASAIKAGKRLAVVGGGWIGMEIAANARDSGADVTVLETAELPLLAVLGPELARVFLALHREHGVEFRLGAHVSEITTRDSHATGVALADGSRVEADVVIVGVGAVPNVELAAEAGLDVDNGVLVDEALQTSDPDITAAVTSRTTCIPGSARECASSTGRTLSTSRRQPPRRCSAAARRTRSFPTSSPTSTTSAWSTSDTRRPVPTIEWSRAATWPVGSFSPSGSMAAGGCLRA